MKRALSLILSLLMVLSLFTGLNVGAQEVFARSATLESGDAAIPQSDDAALADTGAEAELSGMGDDYPTVLKKVSLDVIWPMHGMAPLNIARIPDNVHYRVAKDGEDGIDQAVKYTKVNAKGSDTDFDRFSSGNVYRVRIYIKPISDAYCFVASEGASCTVNGQTAQLEIKNQRICVTCTLTCRETTIIASGFSNYNTVDRVTLMGSPQPLVGESAADNPPDGVELKPSYSYTPQFKIMAKEWWTRYVNSHHQLITERFTGVFEEGKKYYPRYIVIPTESFSFFTVDTESGEFDIDGPTTSAEFKRSEYERIDINGCSVDTGTGAMYVTLEPIEAVPDPREAVSTVSCNVIEPWPGNYISSTVVPGDDQKYTATVEVYEIYFPNEYLSIHNNSESFIKSKSYRVRVTFTPKKDYRFADNATFYINGEKATWVSDTTYQRIFEMPSRVVDSVNVNLKEPIPNTKPSFDATYADGPDRDYEITSVQWYYGYTQNKLTADDEFKSGKLYRVQIYLRPKKDGTEFATVAEGLTGTLNGNNCEVTNDEKNPRRYAVLTKTFMLYSDIPYQEYDLWLGSTQVTSINQDDIFWDGTASFDPETNTLNLNEPVISGKYYAENAVGSCKIYAGFDLTIKGSYHMSAAETKCGIYVNGSLRLNGDFTIMAESYGVENDFFSGKTFIDGGSIYIESEVYGFWAHEVVIAGAVECVEIDGIKQGRSALNSYVTVDTALEIKIPVGGVIIPDKKGVYESDGTTLARHVLFAKYTTITTACCTVTEPVAGQKPSYTATVPAGKGYQVEEDFTDGTWKNGVLWHNDTDNKDMTENDTFEADKQYTVTVLLELSDDNYSFISSVSGTMNSDYAKVINYGDGTIAVYRTFTCTATVISDFSVTNIIEPVAGASPSYIAAVPADKGYRVKDLNGTYTKNGVMWRNENNERLDPSTAVFEAGKVYKVYVYLEPVSDAYELASSDRTGTVNGKEADVWIDSSQNHVFLIATFTCKSSAILGDVDGDSAVTIIDATYIQRHLASIPIPFVLDEAIADTDEDGLVSIMDVTYIQRWLAHLKSNDHIGQPM